MTEDFADTSYPVSKSNVRKNEFIYLGQGTHAIRILQPKALAVYTHYLNRSSVKCLGDECPICKNNRLIYDEYPESYRDAPGYSARRKVFYVNVLDKTPAKVCPKCGFEDKNIKHTECTECDTALPEATPLNKVKILNKGVQLFDLLNALNKGVVHPETHEPIGLTHYDVILTVSGAGRDKKTSPIHSLDLNNLAEEDVPEEQLFELEGICPTLEPSEMLDLQRGISMRDIFAARRAKNDASYTEDFFGEDDGSDDVLSDDVQEDMRNKINDLFAGG